MSISYTLCPAGTWTPLYQAPSYGVVNLWSSAGAVPLRWRAYSASTPWYMSGQVVVNGQLPVWVSLPSVYVQLEVFPDFNALLRAT
ncbi:MAG: hypothetical protein HOP28_12335 [Gemmatimonadales bacterium]|nr:hypothetical protein [Gemmatimonadales bacterium]